MNLSNYNLFILGFGALGIVLVAYSMYKGLKNPKKYKYRNWAIGTSNYKQAWVTAIFVLSLFSIIFVNSLIKIFGL